MIRTRGSRFVTRCLLAACLLFAVPVAAKVKAPTHPFRSYPGWARHKPAAWVCDVDGTHGVCGIGKVAKVRDAGLRHSAAEGDARTAIARFLEGHDPTQKTLVNTRVVKYWDDGRRRAAAMVFAPVSR